ncbi:MAG: TonB-dependent receptor [Bryobacteraceae bacterium]
MKSKAVQCCVLLCLSALFSWAQTGLATLTGTVTDQTGAVMADVTVQATQVATGTTLEAATSATGNYTITPLRPGDYEVTVERAGFKTYKRAGITLAAAQILRLDVQLEVGATTDSVTVTAEATLLQTDTGTLVKNITVANIRNLPLLPVGTFVRDPFAIGNILPGVIQNFVATRVNGQGQNTIQYRLDGEILGQVSFAGITTRTQPSPDAVEEVAVQTSNISAEFGSASGAVFNVSIKSGTNKFHGTVYDYAVNEILNSGDPANHLKNRVRRHDYGFNIGGPVKIPGVYDGTNKTFFFFNWEQYRDTQRQTTFTFPTVPTDAYRKGNFSGLFSTTANANLRLNVGGTVRDYVDPYGNTVKLGTVYDPNSTTKVTCSTAVSQDCGGNGNVLNVRTPFVGNVVPVSLFDPVAVAVLTKYVPLPNQGTALINNYFNPFTSSRITSSPALKADQNFGSKARLSFTYTNNKTDSAVQALGGLAEGFPSLISRNTGTFESGSAFRANFDYTVTPTINWHIGVGYSLFSFNTRPQDTSYNAQTDIGLRGATANKNFPLFNLGADTVPANGGINTLGTPGQSGNAERRPSMTQTVTWVHGNHTVKAGGDFRQDMLPNFGFGGTNGNYTFTGNGITWNPALINTVGFNGNSNIGFTFANFLLGSVRTASLNVPALYRRSKQQWGTFIQDSWRVRRNLTVDLGLRWDYGTYPKEDYGRLGALSLTAPNDSASGHPGGLIYEATCNCNFAHNYPYGVGPRVGVAYTLNSKTVLRGGIGLAYNSTGTAAGGSVINNANTDTPPVGFDSFKLKDGIPSTLQPQWPVYRTGAGLLPGAVGTAPTLIDPNAGRPDRTIQFNLALQREITRDLVVEAAYVGNRNVWQATGGFQDFNAISEQTLAKYNFSVGNLTDATLLNTQLQLANPSALAVKGVFLPYSNFPTGQTVLQSLRTYSQYTTAIQPAGAMGKTWYDSLQLSLNKRFSRGLQASMNYTYSKNLQYLSNFDIFNPTTGKDIVGANPPQLLRIAFEYQVQRPNASIPVLGNKVVSWAVRDWAISGALFYQTATYLGRPSNSAANPISRWLGFNRGLGSAQLKQNADGSYMSPWSVNWTDNSGKKRTDPLDINCNCFDPRTTQVLNPNAWSNVPDAKWAAQTNQLPFFRNARRPNENANVARNFRFGSDGRYNLQVRVEFQNIFNRKFVPAPTLGNFATPATPVLGGTATAFNAGFGTFGNQTVAGVYGAPRSGQFIARFSF